MDITEDQQSGEPRASKPLVFLTPPAYPLVDFRTVDRFQYGNNQYTRFGSTEDQELSLQALSLRCHREDRLLQNKYLTHGNYSSWLEVRLPIGIILADFTMTPKPPTQRVSHRAVAIDCEMVGVQSGIFEGKKEKERSELAQLCAVDILTGEILIDKLVLPRERVLNWRTRFSGVNYPAIMVAKTKGRLLRGWQAARAELLSYIDSDTILVGHGLYNDLQVLRLAHDRIIDTAIQTAEVVYGDMKLGRTWGLEDLAKALLGLTIQAGKKGHDCVEDTLATRELALWCVRHPTELEAWAAKMRIELEERRIKREKKLEEQRQKREVGDAEQKKKIVDSQGWPHVALPSLGAGSSFLDYA